MSHASEPLPDFIQLAQHAFASQGYAPSDAVRKAAAKGLARLDAPQVSTGVHASEVSFEDMLKRCADA
jgi:hypothetical protein